MKTHESILLEIIQEALYTALMTDLENGRSRLNKEDGLCFIEEYPALYSEIQNIMSMSSGDE